MKRLTVIVILLIGGLVTLQTGCMMSSPLTTPKLLLREHQLVNKIWDVNQQVYIEQATLVNRVLESNYLLLGERHDNLEHHQHQTWIIQQLAKARHQASVAFEMIDNDQGSRLAKQSITSVEQLIDVLNLSKTFWQYEQRYKSLFAAVLAAGYPIDAANMNGKQLMQTVMQGEDKLPADYQRILAKTPWSAQQDDALRLDIIESHCRMLDEKTSRKMVLAQRLRDAIMAHSMLQSQAQQKVLIAGTGHVRNDRGVPLYLRNNLPAQAKDSRILAIGFVEVDDGLTDVSVDTKRQGSDIFPFDIVWFTPKVEREDACAQLKQHFKRKD